MRTRTVCGVSRGDPPITLRWLKDGDPLSSMLGANVSSLDHYSSLLSISSLSAMHTGDYTCVASNPAAEVKYTATLKVKGRVYNKIVFSYFFHFHFLFFYEKIKSPQKYAIKTNIYNINYVFLSHKLIYLALPIAP